MKGAHFIGVGIQVGLVLSVWAYVIFGRIRSEASILRADIRLWLGLGFFCGILANVTETVVSFSFSSTRIYFLALRGHLVYYCRQTFTEPEKPLCRR